VQATIHFSPTDGGAAVAVCGRAAGQPIYLRFVDGVLHPTAADGHATRSPTDCDMQNRGRSVARIQSTELVVTPSNLPGPSEPIHYIGDRDSGKQHTYLVSRSTVISAAVPPG